MESTPILNITAHALKAMELYLSHREARGRVLRLHVNGKNCDGFTYGLSFSEWEPGDQVISVTDTIDVLVDERTYMVIDQVTVDWFKNEETQESGFVIHNSAEEAGKFKGKFWKKPNGKEFLIQNNVIVDQIT